MFDSQYFYLLLKYRMDRAIIIMKERWKKYLKTYEDIHGEDKTYFQYGINSNNYDDLLEEDEMIEYVFEISEDEE
jgi:hypothetical protein